jgi:hypothetical protein
MQLKATIRAHLLLALTAVVVVLVLQQIVGRIRTDVLGFGGQIEEACTTPLQCLRRAWKSSQYPADSKLEHQVCSLSSSHSQERVMEEHFPEAAVLICLHAWLGLSPVEQFKQSRTFQKQ